MSAASTLQNSSALPKLTEVIGVVGRGRSYAASQIWRNQSGVRPTGMPVDHMPRHPLSDEASARIRLERLLEREKRAREARLEGCSVEHWNVSPRRSSKIAYRMIV